MTDAHAEAFRALLSAAGADTFILLDESMRIVAAGHGAGPLVDRPGEDLVGMSLIAAFGSADLDELARQAASSHATESAELRLGADLERRFAADVLPLASGGYVIWLRDITTLTYLTQVRQDLVANISHELRTPLTAIKLLAETLSDGAADGETARAFAAQIEAETDQLAQLVNELLELSTIESGAVPFRFETLPAAQVVSRVAERIRPMASRRQVTVMVAGEDDDLLVVADPNRLGQALLNFAHNAVKFSRAGGEVRLGWSRTDGGVRFNVADDGIGIPVHHRQRIWERFYKADRARARTEDDAETDLTGSAGLGLAIVRHIAEGHGGTVGLVSEEGRGSTFWIEIPDAASEP